MLYFRLVDKMRKLFELCTCVLLLRGTQCSHLVPALGIVDRIRSGEMKRRSFVELLKNGMKCNTFSIPFIYDSENLEVARVA